MSALDLADFDALTFDVYGTLIDWEPTIARFLKSWAGREGIETTKSDLLALYDQARAHYQTLRPALPYPDILRRCMAYMADWHGRALKESDREAFAASIATWPAFDDTEAAMATLKKTHTLGALSNIDNASLAISTAKFASPFHFTVTAQDVASYKPDLPHFVHMVSELGRRNIPPNRILHIAQSLRADIVPANRLGLKTVWINRPGRGLGLTGHGAEMARPDWTFATMGALD